MFTEQRIRAVLFYLSVCAFFAGIPFILSFALGYKFDRRTFKFTKTGLIVLKTQPSGANVYLDKRLLNQATPLTLSELLPGKYLLDLELEGHYPYQVEATVEAEKVTRLEKIILFPLRPDVKQLNKEPVSSFIAEEAGDVIYYISYRDNVIYKSDLEGGHFQAVADFLPILPLPKKWQFSVDKEKLLYFNAHQIGIIYLEPERYAPITEPAFIINYPAGSINDVFWHSDSYHIILVSDSKIEILEAKPDSNAVVLMNLNKKNAYSFYDLRTDTLYFLDSQRAADGRLYDNVYKLELSPRSFPFQELIRRKPILEKPEP